MSMLTSKLADKEKRIEENKDQIASYNNSYEVIKRQISRDQERLASALDHNRELKQMINFLMQDSQQNTVSTTVES